MGGLSSGTLLRRLDERRLALLGLINGALGYALIATAWLPAVLAGWTVRGLSLPWIVIAVITAGQQHSPDALQGRVAAAIALLLFAAQPLTQLFGAALLGPLTFREIYLAVAAAGLLLACVLARPAVHRLKSTSARSS